MKKLLTVLLALLVVTGVVFADGSIPTGPPEYEAANVQEGASTKLELFSTVNGKFEHGFARETDQEELGDNAYIVTMQETGQTAADIGFYVLRTNAAVQFGVDFTVSPMANGTVGEDATATAYVPYTLTLTRNSNSTGTRVFNNGSSANEWGAEGATDFVITIGSGSWSEDPISADTKTVISHGTLGSGELVLDLEVDFGTNNDNANAPEGQYTGTIVATITTT